jgi:hypothetical protein
MTERRTETALVNGYNITLPVGVTETMKTKVKDSYQSFTRDGLYHVMRHIYAYTTMMPPLLKEQRPTHILHPFGGLGGMAQLIEQVCDWDVYQEFWERDPDCVAWLREHWHDVVLAQDSIKWLLREEQWLDQWDWIIFDLSVSTIKTPGVKECWERFGHYFRKGTLKAVWLTDTACHKIHLNGRTYAKDFGYDTPTSEEYLRAYDEVILRPKGMCINRAMREAGSYYAMITAAKPERFGEITYMGSLDSLNLSK